MVGLVRFGLELTKSARKTYFKSNMCEKVKALCMVIMRVLVAWMVFKLHSKAVLNVEIKRNLNSYFRVSAVSSGDVNKLF